MRIVLEPWAPEYGAPTDEAVLEPGDTPVDVEVEVPVDEWAPRRPGPGAGPAGSVLFVDGVRRVEARAWVWETDGRDRQALCGSYAAGAVRCDATAHLERAVVERGLFTAAAGASALATRHGTFEVRAVAGEALDQLSIGLQQRMRELEVEVARDIAGAADLVVLDGPLADRRGLAGAVGYVKTHHARYLPDLVADVVPDLAPGERTPLFVTTTKWSRYSWYLRLPGSVEHPWAGIIRCEAAADQEVGAVAELADRVLATLPRFASTPVKDARAPQNLFPIAGLERELRRRLGDPAVLWRALRAAAPAA